VHLPPYGVCSVAGELSTVHNARMILMTVGLGSALGVVLVLATLRVLARIRTLENRPPTASTEPFDDGALWTELRTMQAVVDDQTLAVRNQTLAIAEGIERVGRAEARVTETVRRAKRRADEAGYTDPGIEAEAAELQRVDGDGSEASSVPVLHTDVGDDVSHPSSVRGVSVEQMQRARGW